MMSQQRLIIVLEEFKRQLQARPFIPHRFLFNAHLQTCLAATWKRSFPWSCDCSEQIFFKTSQDVAIHAEVAIAGRGNPTLIAIHGVGGASDAPYMQGLLHKSWRLGWNTVLLNLYDLNLHSSPPVIFHSGSSHQLGEVLRAISRFSWCGPLYVFAVSMGANMLLKFLGESHPILQNVKAAAVISPLVDLMASWRILDRPTNRFYRWHFVRGLKRVVREHSAHLEPFIDVGAFPAISTIREFDELFTAPLGGFKNAFDYYKNSGAHSFLEQIRTPTLLIHSLRDPILPSYPLECRTLTENDFLLPELTHRGGHVGFIEQERRDIDRYWAENRVMDFFDFLHRHAKSP